MNPAIHRALASGIRLRPSGPYLPVALAAVLVVTLLSVSVLAVSAANTRRLAENHRRVVHTIEVLRQLEEVLSIMKDAETGQRGFVMTGKDEYLIPYHSALGSIHKSLDAVAPHFDESGNRGQFVALESEIELKLGELQKTIAIRRELGFEPLRSGSS